MQFITVGQLKAQIVPKLHGNTFDSVNGTPEDKMFEASKSMLSRIDPDATIRKYRIANAIYSDIYSYTLAQDCKGKQKILDLRPIGPRNRRDSVQGRFAQEFDIKKDRNTLSIETINGVRTLRISKDISSNITVWEADSISAVTALGDASTLTVDTLDYVSGIGSVKFNLSGVTGQGGVKVVLGSTVDLSSLESLGALFNWLEYTDDNLISVELRWGTDDNNYWTKTATAPYDRTAFDASAWNLQAFDWKTATKVGSPSSTTIKQVEVLLNYPAGTAQTGVRIDNITASLGAAYEVVYYSNAIFLGVDGVYREKPVSDDDQITLDEAANNIFLYENMKIYYQELKGKSAGADLANCRYELEGDGRVMRGMLVANYPGLYRNYLSGTPSEAMSHQETYHEFDSLDGFGN